MKKIIAAIAMVLTVGLLGAQAAEAHWGNRGPAHWGNKGSVSKLYRMRIGHRMDFYRMGYGRMGRDRVGHNRMGYGGRMGYGQGACRTIK